MVAKCFFSKGKGRVVRHVAVHPEEGHENDQRAGAPLLQGQAERVGAFQPGEERAPRGPYSGLPVPEGGLQESCYFLGLFRRAGSDRIRGNDFKLAEGRYRLDNRKKYCEGGETLEQVSQ